MIYFIVANVSSATANITTVGTPLMPPATSSNGISSSSATLQIPLEPISGTSNFRIYGGKKGKEDKHWMDGRGLSMQHVQCVRKGSCEKLNFSTCLGSKLPYEYTSLDLTISHSQKDIEERLNNSMALKHVPKCWAVIQVSGRQLGFLNNFR